MKLRRYRSQDWDEVVELLYDTVHSVNSADYSANQLDAWVPNDKCLPELKNRLSQNYCVVVESNGVIVGFGNVGGAGYLDCLYTHKDYQGRGVGTLIADDIENRLILDGYKVVSTDASITAKTFFEKRGYVVLNEQTVECRGQHFTNYKMQKTLSR